jgi:hypothetical protein
MKSKEIDGNAAVSEKSAAGRQIHIVVDGCGVKLNFPLKSEDSAVKDVKRMMLGGAIKP